MPRRKKEDPELVAQMKLQELLLQMEKMEAEMENDPPMPPPSKKPTYQKNSPMYKRKDSKKWTQMELNGIIFEVHPSGLVRRLPKESEAFRR